MFIVTAALTRIWQIRNRWYASCKSFIMVPPLSVKTHNVHGHPTKIRNLIYQCTLGLIESSLISIQIKSNLTKIVNDTDLHFFNFQLLTVPKSKSNIKICLLMKTYGKTILLQKKHFTCNFFYSWLLSNDLNKICLKHKVQDHHSKVKGQMTWPKLSMSLETLAILKVSEKKLF